MLRILFTSPIRVILVAVALVFVSPAGATACDCPWPPSPSVEMQNSKMVFMGRLLEGQVKAESFTHKDVHGKTYQTQSDVYHYQFSVEKSWKGQPGKTVTLSSFLSDCMWPFEKSRLYLVYASKGEFDLETSVCSRTREASDIQIELLFLDTAKKGKSELEIYEGILGMAQSHPVSSHRVAAIDFLDQSLPDTLPHDWVGRMIGMFQDKSQRVRARAASMNKYRQTGKPPELIHALVGLLQDEWYTVRIAASDALQSLVFQHNPKVAAALMQALNREKTKALKMTRVREPHRRVVRSFAKSIAKIGSSEDKERVFPYFVEDLGNDDPSIRHDAVVYMSSFGKLAEEAVPQLIQVYKSQTRLRKRITGTVLRNIGTPEARQALEN